MKVRFKFECTRCGSDSFRPSSKWRFRDTLLRKIGITPQRCLKCRRRFYLFYPIAVEAFFNALNNPPAPAQESQRRRVVKVSHTAPSQPLSQAVMKAPALKPPVVKTPVKTDVVWSTFAEADQSDTRS